MTEGRSVPVTRILIRAEFARALGARWVLAYAALFLVLGFVLTALAGGGAVAGYRSALRPFAAVMHTLILFVPVMALIPAVASVADDRDSGLLEYTLAQPVTASSVLLAKWMATAAAMVFAVILGLGPGGAGAVVRGGDPGTVVLLLLVTVLLAVGFVSIGVLLTALTRSRGRAMAVAVVIWLGFVVLGTLGLMTAFVRWGLPEVVLASWSLVNPVEAFRVALLTVLDPDAGLLGPVGQSLIDRLGRSGLVAAALASLVAWSVVPGAIATLVFSARGRTA